MWWSGLVVRPPKEGQKPGQSLKHKPKPGLENILKLPAPEEITSQVKVHRGEAKLPTPRAKGQEQNRPSQARKPGTLNYRGLPGQTFSSTY